MSKSSICIYFSDTGGGHRSAAEAVKAALDQLIIEQSLQGDYHCVLSQAIIEQSSLLNQQLVRLYNHFARHHTTWIKYFYHSLHLLRLESSLFYGLYRSYLQQVLKQEQPSLLVAVHPMVAELLSKARDESPRKNAIKVAIVITDPNEKLWRAWACNSADIIVAPNEIVRNKLQNWGVEPDRIKVLGMPVHPKFLAPPSVPRHAYLTGLGLDPEVFTVCINAGWAGNAHLLEALRALTKCRRKVQAIFLSGFNRDLHQRAIDESHKLGIRSAVLAFHDQMPELMSAIDVMVTKAGGLTTYQAIARRLPLVFDNTIEPMPQEAKTIEMLVAVGIANQINTAQEVIAVIDSLPERRQADSPLPNKFDLHLTDTAIFDIATAILQLHNPKVKQRHPRHQQLQSVEQHAAV